MSVIRDLMDREGIGRLPHSRSGLVAFLLTCAGVFLGATVDMAFLILAAAGIYVPNLLRELGLLRDRDELQREASRRAAMHAYLVGGLFTMAVVIANEWGSADLDDNAYSAAVLLLAFLVPYFCSYLTSFWGARRAAQRILLAFGLFWLLFNILGNLTSPVAMLMQCLVALPFLALALTAGRFPGTTGLLLLSLSVGAFLLFKVHRAFVSDEQFGSMAVFLLFVIPLAYSGASLLGVRRENTDS